MKSMSGKELAKLLEANGWTLLRIQGSHHIYGNEGNSSRISIPIHRNRDLKIGLLRSLLKTADLLDFIEGKATKVEMTSEEQVNPDLSLEIDVDRRYARIVTIKIIYVVRDRALGQLSLNRDDFIRLHRADPQHCGIIVCTNDPDRLSMANRLHEEIFARESSQGNLMRVVRPSK